MTLVQFFNAGLAWLAYLLGVRRASPRTLGRSRRIVIVGGGFSGVTLAHYLESTTQCDVVLVDRKDYFEYTPAMLRCMVQPSHWSRVMVPYTRMPMLQSPRIRVVHDEVVELTDQAVRMKGSGEWCRYDKLVLAMGSDYYDHIKPDFGSLTVASRQAQIDALHRTLCEATSVNIFGAGLVGVELAAEIVETFPQKKLTLRSREPTLLPGFPEKAQKYALTWFRSRGVQVILDNTIPPSKYAPEEGEVVYNCTGLKPVKLEEQFFTAAASESQQQQDGKEAKRNNSSSSSSSASSSASPPTSTPPTGMGRPLLFSTFVDARSHAIRVTPQFHLIGGGGGASDGVSSGSSSTSSGSGGVSIPSIFALGDVMIEDSKKDSPPASRAPKVAYQAELQAWVVAENIRRQLEGEETAGAGQKRAEWTFPQDVIGGGVSTLPTVVDCSLGSRDGILILNDFVITGRLTAIQKDILEVTKMMFMRGNILGEIVWTLVDPLSLAAHRMYVAVKGDGEDKGKTD